MIGLNQHETEQALKHRWVFFSPPAAPNWFGAEIAHKSDVHQRSFEREFVTHPLIRRLLLGSMTSDFQRIKKQNMQGSKKLEAKDFSKTILQNDLAT